jgi:ABC-type multidrug transport system ATPase subunit
VNAMKIYSKAQKELKDDHLVLVGSDWDDYGLQSTFFLSVVIGGKEKKIGELKAIHRNILSGRVSILESDNGLDDALCTLGQNVEYYNEVHRLGREVERRILTSLRDCAFDSDIYEEFSQLPQFRQSAIRFSTAEQALQRGLELYGAVSDGMAKPSVSFNFRAKLAGFDAPYQLAFEYFDGKQSLIPSNINILIGRNGTGKTQLLSVLAKAISGYGYDRSEEMLKARAEQFPSGRPAFGNVIVVSYSAFDSFEIPGKNEVEKDKLAEQGHIFGYVYCGLRERIGLGEYRIKSTSEITSEFSAALKTINDDGLLLRVWKRCLNHVLGDPSFAQIKLGHLHDQFSNLSSGQKIILSILAKIIEHIKPSSIVIVDEPETHLHPSLMAAFLHAIRDVLDEFQSFALMATHSPVILQETPSRFVQVLEGGRQKPKVSRLSKECFGEEISTLTTDVFKVDSEESNFLAVLKKLAKSGSSPDEINAMFGKKIGLTARSFIANFYK